MDETIDNFDVIEDAPIEAEFAGEHAETLVDGILDTIQGNESFHGGLTRAQEYLKAVMEVDGVSFHSVHGTEGVMDKIKSGAHKAWEAVKRAFKAIWSFFFDKKIERQAKSIFDTAKEFRQTADQKIKGYNGEVNQESLKKRFAMIEKVEKELDEKADAATKKALDELPKNFELNKPYVKMMKEAAEEIRKTYGLMDIIKAIHKPADLSTAVTKLEEVTKKIVAHQDKVRGVKSNLDSTLKEIEAIMADPVQKGLIGNEHVEMNLKVVKTCAAIFQDYITAIQKKMNLVSKLMSSIDRLFAKPAQA
ncbi:hypothetical protein RISINGSUN_71 [Erwinia phage vB_EamM_RisingSun]|uniref:Uncharacterized protein n=1 Tax=Erwinia phage vB_EamM_RisingSun TaxID=2026080 RepID=A0A223LJB5_9CAUD|nr:hypothetical protein FDI45_gp071 [Erwinia phage vB_EamM_RisingSun]ASU03599.1 hypothetical protein RISINGSUN_71 [Erwinia phage vB_EamM_RisingSun]